MSLGGGECDILGVASADGLENYININILCGELAEYFISNAGHIGHADYGYPCDIRIFSNTSYEHFFHGSNLLDYSSGRTHRT